MGLFKVGMALPLKRARHDITDDCHVYIREMSAQEQLTLNKKQGMVGFESIHFLWDIIAMCVCDENGKALFASVEEAMETFTIAVSQVEKIVEAILDLSGCNVKKKIG